MTGHDPLCPTNQNDDPDCWFCEHNARVRADERARWGLGWIAAADNVAALAHAEAVAARLVEVIVRDAIEISNLHGEIKQGVADWYSMKDERDAARAEASGWKRYAKVVEEQRDAARAEVVALREQIVFLERHVGAEVDAGREVLVDLREQVEGLIDPGCMRVVGGCDCQRTRALRQVLALLDEVQP